MEIVTYDSPEIVSLRAHEAALQIGRVLEYQPTEFVEAKVYSDGYPALLTVEWRPHRDGERIRLDISATSRDELSRAADAALYRFADAFKAIREEDLPALAQRRARNRVLLIAGSIVGGIFLLAAAHVFGLTPFR
jgi:hypothetical protein